MARPPSSVLFACNWNAARSPMAEAIAKYLYGHLIYVDSAGVGAGELDPFAVAALDELGVDLSGHKPKSFDELEDTSFDLVVTLTPEAQHRAMEMTRTMSFDVEYWASLDPTTVEGSRERVLEAYRQLRDDLFRRIESRFQASRPPVV